MSQQVTVTYLEMKSPGGLRRKAMPDGARVEMVPQPTPEWNREFYVEVGGEYAWTDRLPWNRERWLEYLEQPGVETWILTFNGQRAGYFELAPQPDGSIDLAYFGLLRDFTGQGLGGALLTFATERAWQKGACTVTVNTCTLDHPAALQHYLARGFQIARTVTRDETTPPSNGDRSTAE